MAVNWNWKNKMGVLVYKTQKGKFKVNLYQANCLGALIHEFKEDGKPMYRFMGFWNDTDHLKRCLGLKKNYDNFVDNIYEDVIKIRLNTYYEDNIKIAKLFAKANIKVELYYKEMK